MICPTASGWVFSDAVTNKNTASDDRMINEELARIWKETALHWGTIPKMFMDELRKLRKTYQNDIYLQWDSKAAPPEYK